MGINDGMYKSRERYPVMIMKFFLMRRYSQALFLARWLTNGILNW